MRQITRANGSIAYFIKAKDIKIGMTLAFDNPFFDAIVDDVRSTRENDVLIRTGADGTGTEWREKNELILITL